MELGVWIKDDKGTEYVLQGSNILTLTTGMPLENPKDVAWRLFGGLTGGYGPGDLRREDYKVVRDLYEEAKKRLP